MCVNVCSYYIYIYIQRVLLKHNLKLRGGILMSGHVHGEFPGKFESSNLSRSSFSRLQDQEQDGLDEQKHL